MLAVLRSDERHSAAAEASDLRQRREWELVRVIQPCLPSPVFPLARPLCRAATNGLRVAAPRRDASCMSGVASWAVFLDNATMLNTVLEYYKSGRGNGRLEHYIYASGQCQESGRDQGHTQLGIR